MGTEKEVGGNYSVPQEETGFKNLLLSLHYEFLVLVSTEGTFLGTSRALHTNAYNKNEKEHKR